MVIIIIIIGPISVSRLSNLEYLSLSGNIFNNSILSYVSTLSSLKQLELYEIGLKGIIDLQDMPTFKNLESLWMYDTVFNNNFYQIGVMTSLKNLTMWDCTLKDTLLYPILPAFKSLKDVEFVSMALNNFPAILNGSCNSLESLSLTDCNLTNTLLEQG
ncbi:hypothetical protein Patl1_26560 [Pistacia atlantica]|uniref:Uncharacterized protein n=1 Tax=Pistacia atlantica TaxID=434234 RepID=A0ACC1B0K4_9ROSI|nr:hypothetical protein Patl1_26560 [Pistacia atlantica]